MRTKIDISKYYNITDDEIDSIVKVVARLFIGNNLVFYVVKTANIFGYIMCDTYDDICRQFKTTIKDKSNIQRITFKTPDNFDVNNVKLWVKNTLETTDTSANDAMRIFNGNTFMYSRAEARVTERELKKELVDYCSKKYAKEIEADIKAKNTRQLNEFTQKLEVMPFIELYDDSLKEVVAYVCIDKSSLVRMMGIAEYTAQLYFSVDDIKRLGYKLNIVSTINMEPKIHGRVYGSECKILRHYGKIEYNGYNIAIQVLQSKDGILSSVPSSFYDGLGISKDNTLNYSTINGLKEDMEQWRLQGNKWFNNNGETFIKTRRQLSNKTNIGSRNIMTMFKR